MGILPMHPPRPTLVLHGQDARATLGAYADSSFS